MLKNCIFNRINEIRELKKKPKLGDVLKYFKAKEWPKEKVAKKLTQLYSNYTENGLEDDPKFIQLNTYFEDMKKNFQLNLDILDEINTKLNQLANRRKVREQQAKEQVDFFEEMSDYKRKEEEIEKKKEERKQTQ